MFSPSKAMMRVMRDKKLLPSISDTERQALEAGDVSIDGHIFSGKIRFDEILAMPYGGLTAEEQAFIAGPCQELCAMVDAWKVYNERRVPDDALEFIKRNGFMGMMIPRKWGGKGFSRLAISTVIAKLMPHCSQVASVVIIANSLSAAELLIHYGTPAQQDYYLPMLASGEFIPCFGLTELTAGSDAEAIKVTGVVFKDGDELKLRLNFEKRFMTLGSIANIATIACKVHDPENLLGKGENVGITTVLVHRGTPGFHNGDHHMPIGAGFENGPLIGRDVVVSVDNIIGGAACAGLGWKMLMEQLAGGRGISLPAGAVGGMKTAMAATGAFSSVRHQFGMPIGKMKGVQQKVGKIAYLTYMFDAGRIFLCTTIDQGTKPPVTSGMLKAYATEAAMDVLRYGMDVFAGAAVMQGENNILGLLFQSGPVGVTVEGANIMTISFLVNGQGAVRCHPYSYPMTRAIETDNAREFRKNLMCWVGHVGLGFARTRMHSFTRGAFISVPSSVHPATRKLYKRLGWLGARFGLLSDAALLLIRGDLKKEGLLNARYSDAFAWNWLAISALRRFEAEGQRPEDLPLVRAAVEHSLYEIQKAYEGIYANFTAPVASFFMRTVLQAGLRMNPLSLGVSDKDIVACAQSIQHYDDQYRRLCDGVYMPAEDKPALGRLLKAFRMQTEAEGLRDKVTAAQKRRELPRAAIDSVVADQTAEGGFRFVAVDQAAEAGVLTAAEAQQLKDSIQAGFNACQVDVFTDEHYYR